MNRASPATGWVRNPVMKSSDLDPHLASSYELGWTYNPITGCLNHINGLCLGGMFPCYAYKLAHGRLKPLYLANTNRCPMTGYQLLERDKAGHLPPEEDPFYPRYWAERINDWDIWSEKPKGIFPCDMGELFGDWLPEKWQHRIFRVFEECPQHRFYLLTKQPQNLIKFSPFPPNCYVGVSVTRNNQLDNALRYLKQIQATTKFISFEPLLERIELDF